MTRVLFIFLLVGMINGMATAQTKAERRARSQEAIAALQTGGLIVRLNTNTRKIEALEARLAKPDLPAKQRRYYEKLLASTRTETRQSNQLLVGFMLEKYHLGPLYFLPDTSFSKSTSTVGPFVNGDLEVDSSISPPAGDFLMMRIGFSDPTNSARAEGFILTDSALEVIPDPFPSIITFNNAGFALNSLLAPSMAEERRLQTAVERLVNKLERLMD